MKQLATERMFYKIVIVWQLKLHKQADRKGFPPRCEETL